MFGVEPLLPAYGRVYNSLKAVQDDLDGGKDFRTPAGSYISLKELASMGVTQIMCRYGKNGLTKTGMLKIKPKV